MSLADTQHYGLVVVSAPSGAGKSTLCADLLKNLPDRLALSISTTSRAPRGSEIHGKEYYFVSSDEFKKQIATGSFAESANVHGNYYGTSRKTLETFWNQKKHVLLDIDVQGAESLRMAYPEKCFSVFIDPPSIEELERRLRGRGTETEAAIQKRMQNSRDEIKEKNKFDSIIVNDIYQTTFESLQKQVVKFMNELESGKWQKQK